MRKSSKNPFEENPGAVLKTAVVKFLEEPLTEGIESSPAVTKALEGYRLPDLRLLILPIETIPLLSVAC